MLVNKILVSILIVGLVGVTTAWFVRGEDAPAASTAPSVVTSSSTPAESDATATALSLTAEEVAKHASETDCWSIVDGNVYDLTAYVPRHNGGVEEILKACGVDGTDLFTGAIPEGESHSPNAQRDLDALILGPLEI